VQSDELILTGPRRAFVTPDRIFFEINLKIKGAPESQKEISAKV
jgi:hypothetical protein